MDEPLIHREEVVALLFNVADIAAALNAITEDDDDMEEDDEG
ncbi:MAG TPA: hypothetical protein VGJ77_10650 [Gaiellaceae bacterium]